MPLSVRALLASNSAANEWWAMTAGAESTRPTNAENAAIFTFMNGLQRVLAHSTAAGQYCGNFGETCQWLPLLLQLLQLALRDLVVGVEFDRLFVVLDRAGGVVLLRVGLPERGIGCRRLRKEFRVELQPRHRIVGLVGIDERRRHRDERRLAEVVALAAVILRAEVAVLLH